MISIKLQNASDIRRITVSENLTFSELNQIAYSTFGNALPSSFLFKYKDFENEYITLTTDVELSEAIRTSQQANHTLRVMIVHPWLPVSVSKAVPFQLDPSKYIDTARPWIQIAQSRVANVINNIRSRPTPRYDILKWKKCILALILFFFLCRGFSMFFFIVMGVVYYRYSGNFFSSSPRPRGDVRINHNHNPVPSAPIIEDEIQQPVSQMYPNVNQQQADRGVIAFQEKLAQLYEMGFSDRNLNIQVLTQNRGDLLKSVKDLLA